MNAYQAIELNPIENAILALTTALYQPPCFDAMTKEEMRDALSSGQLMSKKWLLEHLDPHLSGINNLIVVGGWIGLLAKAIHAMTGVHVTSLDICPKATTIASQVLLGVGEALLGDMYVTEYTRFQCVVNTSLEHIPDVRAWIDLIDAGTLVVVQSNNARHIEDHVNCVDSVIELKALLGLSEVLYEDELKFPMYTRYMVIGRK